LLDDELALLEVNGLEIIFEELSELAEKEQARKVLSIRKVIVSLKLSRKAESSISIKSFEC